jgi:8-oxo-dGTP pyrophosphatase MutT (NUDIX family)
VSEPTIRQAVRGLLVADEQILLIHTFIPDSGKLIWLAPGGGTEAGESAQDCLLREVFEETGLQIDKHDGLVWQRRHTFRLHGQLFDQCEDYYLVRCDRFEPVAVHNPAELERDIFRGFRWWDIASIKASGDIFVPLTMGLHLQNLLRDGPPREPIDVGL